MCIHHHVGDGAPFNIGSFVYRVLFSPKKFVLNMDKKYDWDRKEYREYTYDERILYNSERTAKNVAAIFWVVAVPIIIGAGAGLLYLLFKIAI